MPDLDLSAVRPLTPAEVAETRASLDAVARDVVVAPGVRIDERPIGGRPGLRLRPAGGGRAGVGLLLHGGGYRAGSPASSRGVASYVAAGAALELRVPAYRLAPEHPWPAALEDAVAALRELLDDGVDPQRLVVVGESAGGGLAVAALLAARAAGLPRPRALVLLSPWLDLTAASASYDRCAATDEIISRETSLRSADAYLAGADPRDPLASPAFAEDDALAGLPPTLVQASTAEVLVDEARELADRLRRAGVPARLQTWPDASHLWHVGVPDAPAARDALDRVIEFLEFGHD